MCCGYRVLLSSPSLLAIDFTVFVRFIPFYFHQGKLGCQDLLTRNKPLSLSWLSPPRAACKGSRLCVTRREAPDFTHPQPPRPSHSGCAWIRLSRGQSQKPVPEVTHVPLLHWHPRPRNCALQLGQSHWKASLCHVLVTKQESARTGTSACMAQDNTGTQIHTQMQFGFSTYVFTVSMSGHFMRKKQNIRRDTLKATGI